MTISSRSILLWSPRLLGVVVSLFVSAFALDTIHQGVRMFLLQRRPD